MFKHDLIKLPTLIRIDGEERYYQTPTGQKYPSVTTVLSAMSDKSALIRWRARVGEAEANKVSGRASSRGTAVHKLCEQFVLNECIDLSTQMPFAVSMFKQLEKFLTDDVTNIRLSEGQLFSHKLMVAGSVDLVATYRNYNAIIDFKTSAKLKKEEWIRNYFLQAAMYSYMLWEMTQIHHPWLVIAIAVEEEDQPQIFVENVNDWISEARDMCKCYHAR